MFSEHIAMFYIVTSLPSMYQASYVFFSHFIITAALQRHCNFCFWEVETHLRCWSLIIILVEDRARIQTQVGLTPQTICFHYSMLPPFLFQIINQTNWWFLRTKLFCRSHNRLIGLYPVPLPIHLSPDMYIIISSFR